VALDGEFSWGGPLFWSKFINMGQLARGTAWDRMQHIRISLAARPLHGQLIAKYNTKIHDAFEPVPQRVWQEYAKSCLDKCGQAWLSAQTMQNSEATK